MPRRRKSAQELTNEQALRRLFPTETRRELRDEARKARKKGK
jgi:hypothetical protein